MRSTTIIHNLLISGGYGTAAGAIYGLCYDSTHDGLIAFALFVPVCFLLLTAYGALTRKKV